MVSGQSKHIIPVDKTDKLLIGNGAQRALPHLIGKDFINIAKQDGKVLEIDEKTIKLGATEDVELCKQAQRMAFDEMAPAYKAAYDEFEDLFNRSDNAMYQAKKAGKNRYYVYKE